jgi:hypothetical protein
MFKFLLSFLIVTVFGLKAQSQSLCQFNIDTTSILEDQNLPPFIKALESKSFKIYKNTSHIPVSWKQQLDCLVQSFTIANPNEDFFGSCTDSDSLPLRRLQLLLIRKDLMVMIYERGQGGAGPIDIILLCKFSNNRLVDLWTSFAPHIMKSKEDILWFLKNPKAKISRHSNFVYF